MGAPLRTEGIEIVDEEGNVWARLGRLADDVFGAYYGVGVYGPGGELRASLAVGPTGPHLVLNEGGDAGLFLGVLDPLDDLEVLDGIESIDATGPCIAVALGGGGSATLWPDVLGPLVPEDDAAPGAGDEGEGGR